MEECHDGIAEQRTGEFHILTILPTYIHACMHTYRHVLNNVQANVAYMHMYVCVRVYVQMQFGHDNKVIFIYIRSYVHTCMHACIHTHVTQKLLHALGV
jgi:hypothetical protein